MYVHTSMLCFAIATHFKSSWIFNKFYHRKKILNSIILCKIIAHRISFSLSLFICSNNCSKKYEQRLCCRRHCGTHFERVCSCVCRHIWKKKHTNALNLCTHTQHFGFLLGGHSNKYVPWKMNWRNTWCITIMSSKNLQ